MSKSLKAPTAHANNIIRIADFTEMECMRLDSGSVSASDVSRAVCRIEDADAEDDVNQFVEDAFYELSNRARHCGDASSYPFALSSTGTKLMRKKASSPHCDVYTYLLLATQLNMKTEKVQGGQDATVVFEHLCSEVAERYWGGPHAHVGSLVFGTGRDWDDAGTTTSDVGVFRHAIEDLCKRVGEGHAFQNRNAGSLTAKDGKLDIVVWRDFADSRVGKLIGFGQCKTGTNWEADLMKLRPEGFCQKWLLSQPPVVPVRLYFVCDRVVDRWYDRCVDGGLIFDRCRIVEYADKLSASTAARIKKWTDAALATTGLQAP